MNNLVYSESIVIDYIDDDFAVLTDNELEDILLLDEERLILRYHDEEI